MVVHGQNCMVNENCLYKAILKIKLRRKERRTILCKGVKTWPTKYSCEYSMFFQLCYFLSVWSGPYWRTLRSAAASSELLRSCHGPDLKLAAQLGARASLGQSTSLVLGPATRSCLRSFPPCVIISPCFENRNRYLILLCQNILPLHFPSWAWPDSMCGVCLLREAFEK